MANISRSPARARSSSSPACSSAAPSCAAASRCDRAAAALRPAATAWRRIAAASQADRAWWASRPGRRSARPSRTARISRCRARRRRTNSASSRRGGSARAGSARRSSATGQPGAHRRLRGVEPSWPPPAAARSRPARVRRRRSPDGSLAGRRRAARAPTPGWRAAPPSAARGQLRDEQRAAAGERVHRTGTWSPRGPRPRPVTAAATAAARRPAAAARRAPWRSGSWAPGRRRGRCTGSTAARQTAAHVREPVQSGLVGPVHVLDDQHGGLTAQRLDHRAVEALGGRRPSSSPPTSPPSRWAMSCNGPSARGASRSSQAPASTRPQ